MQTRYEQEIDLVDLLLDWLSHWRSLFICLLIGCVVGVGWYYVGAKNDAEAEAAASAQAEAEAAAQAEAEAAAQAEAEAQAAAVVETETTKDAEYYESILSEAEKVEVDELAALYTAYQDAAEEYLGEDAKADDTSALSDLAVTRDAIATIEARLTDNQLAYYYLVLGYSTVAEVAIIKKSVLSCVIFAMLHFIFFALIYVFNGVQKHSENLGEVLGCADLVRLVDWTKGDALKGLDKAIYNAKMKNIERLNIEDAMQMNADTLAGLVNSDAKVAVIGKDTKAEALAFVDCAKKAHEQLQLEYLTGVSDSVANSRALADVKAVVLMVKVGCSKTAEVIEDYKKLQGRGVKVIGVCAVE